MTLLRAVRLELRIIGDIRVPEYIERESLLAYIKDLPTWWEDGGGVYGPPMKYPEGNFDPEDVISAIENAPAANVSSAHLQEWRLRPAAFFMDTMSEKRELFVSITAVCSGCGERHPNNAVVEWDLEAEKQKALEKFLENLKPYTFARYCPNCGARMNVESTDAAME